MFRPGRALPITILLGIAAAAALMLLVAATGGPPAKLAPRAIPPIALADRPLRLAVLGTSLTARYRWPEALAGRLSACLGREVELGRFAAPGQGSAWGEQAAEEARRFAPDLVLVEFLANDADLRHRRGVAGSRESHARIIATLRRDGARPAIVLVAMGPAFGPRGWLRTRLDGFHAMYAALAAEADLGLVDTMPAWSEALAATPAASLFPDGLHPEPAAQQRVMLETLLAPIGRALSAAQPGCGALAG